MSGIFISGVLEIVMAAKKKAVSSTSKAALTALRKDFEALQADLKGLGGRCRRSRFASAPPGAMRSAEDVADRAMRLAEEAAREAKVAAGEFAEDAEEWAEENAENLRVPGAGAAHHLAADRRRHRRLPGRDFPAPLSARDMKLAPVEKRQSPC